MPLIAADGFGERLDSEIGLGEFPPSLPFRIGLRALSAGP
jgi:hypothetical protein